VSLERVETAGQLGAVGLEPLVELPEGLDADAVEPALRIAADLDEARLAQHLQVPGHARLVHPDRVDDLRHGTLASPYSVEDPTPGRFCDHIEDRELSGHVLNIHDNVYMYKRMF
jgi:hypothetical protein